MKTLNITKILLTTSMMIVSASAANAATPVVDQLGAGVKINQTSNLTTVTQTGKFATNKFTSLDTNVGETLQFILPSSSAVSVNKVTNGQATLFKGLLKSNLGTAEGAVGGHIVIQNEAGLTFAPGSQVNVGALTATTAKTITTKSGNLQFTDFTDASVNLNGDIKIANGGQVNVLAKVINVGSTGTIDALNGVVNLAAGSETYAVDLDGKGKLYYSRPNLDTATVNVDGNIKAYSGYVNVTARSNDIHSSVINLNGVVDTSGAAYAARNGELPAGTKGGAGDVALDTTGDINVNGKIKALAFDEKTSFLLDKSVGIANRYDSAGTVTLSADGNIKTSADSNITTLGEAHAVVDIQAGHDVDLNGKIIAVSDYFAATGVHVASGDKAHIGGDIATIGFKPIQVESKGDLTLDGKIDTTGGEFNYYYNKAGEKVVGYIIGSKASFKSGGNIFNDAQIDVSAEGSAKRAGTVVFEAKKGTYTQGSNATIKATGSKNGGLISLAAKNATDADFSDANLDGGSKDGVVKVKNTK